MNFQTIRLKIQLPDGTTAEQDFIGPALCDKETFEEIKKKPIAKQIKGFAISPPHKYEEEENNFGDLVE